MGVRRTNGSVTGRALTMAPTDPYKALICAIFLQARKDMHSRNPALRTEATAFLRSPLAAHYMSLMGVERVYCTLAATLTE